MTTSKTVGEAAHIVRSKNAGPFWLTLDVFLDDDESYLAVAEAPSLNAEVIGSLYRVVPELVRIYRLPAHPRREDLLPTADAPGRDRRPRHACRPAARPPRQTPAGSAAAPPREPAGLERRVGGHDAIELVARAECRAAAL